MNTVNVEIIQDRLRRIYPIQMRKITLVSVFGMAKIRGFIPLTHRGRPINRDISL